MHMPRLNMSRCCCRFKQFSNVGISHLGEKITNGSPNCYYSIIIGVRVYFKYFQVKCRIYAPKGVFKWFASSINWFVTQIRIWEGKGLKMNLSFTHSLNFFRKKKKCNVYIKVLVITDAHHIYDGYLNT